MIFPDNQISFVVHSANTESTTVAGEASATLVAAILCADWERAGTNVVQDRFDDYAIHVLPPRLSG